MPNETDFVQYETKNNFPETGELNVVYLDSETDICYKWNPHSNVYERTEDRPKHPPRIP